MHIDTLALSDLSSRSFPLFENLGAVERSLKKWDDRGESKDIETPETKVGAL
jgi:hypothetical protein